MSFMDEIEPRMMRLSDGAIDYRRYESIARQERRAAIDRFFQRLRRVLARNQAQCPDRRRTPLADLREA